MSDQIRITGLRVQTHIGVGELERATEQTIEIDIRISPRASFANCEDDIAATIDYAQVVEVVTALAATKPRALVETLAEEIATLILESWDVKRVGVEIRKFILPNTASVGVRIERPLL